MSFSFKAFKWSLDFMFCSEKASLFRFSPRTFASPIAYPTLNFAPDDCF